MKIKKNKRGFPYAEFTDKYGNTCSIQKSSIATEDCIWLGVDDAKPMIMASLANGYGIKTKETTGWVPYPIPEVVSLSTRMHLTQKQVRKLLPLLQNFVDTGEIN